MNNDTVTGIFYRISTANSETTGNIGHIKYRLGHESKRQWVDFDRWRLNQFLAGHNPAFAITDIKVIDHYLSSIEIRKVKDKEEERHATCNLLDGDGAKDRFTFLLAEVGTWLTGCRQQINTCDRSLGSFKVWNAVLNRS